MNKALVEKLAAVAPDIEMRLSRLVQKHVLEGEYVLDGIVKVTDDAFLDALVVKWSKRVLAMEHKQGMLKVPRTWWEAWKEQKAPVWFRQRWPVQYKTYVARVMFPMARIPQSDLFGKEVVVFAEVRMPDGSETGMTVRHPEPFVSKRGES